MAWTDQLQQASFRGVPFGVLTSPQEFGRRQAVHEYPYRDKPWIEDLGRATRHIGFKAFLIENSAAYGGGAAIDQKNQLIGALETSGSGTLVHPTLGSLTVNALPSTILDQWDTGRYFELSLFFIETGEKTFPSGGVATGDAVAGVADTADGAASTDLTNTLTPLLGAGPITLPTSIAAVQAWVGQVQGLAQDATNLYGLASQLPGDFGRFFNGRNLGGLVAGVLSNVAGDTTVAELAQTAAEARAAIATAADQTNTIAANLGLGSSDNTSADLAASAQGLCAALLAATADPADGVRLLGEVAAYSPPAALTMQPTASAIGDVFRRAAVVSVARASATYQPWSYDDAASLRTTVTGLLDNEIQVAGDEGDDQSYNALRGLRIAVVQDLTARGASLARMTTVTSAEPTPALVLAQRLYRDASRADQLVTEANPISPLFMPTTFNALAA